MKRQLGDLLLYSVVCGYLTIAYFPQIFGQERSKVCTMKAGLANALFGWVLIGGQIVVSIIWLVGYLCKKNNAQALSMYVKMASLISTLLNGLFILVGWPIWFYTVQILWSDIDSGECLNGYNLFDFINFMILLIISVWPAVLMLILVLTSCCWIPAVKR